MTWGKFGGCEEFFDIFEGDFLSVNENCGSNWYEIFGNMSTLFLNSVSRSLISFIDFCVPQAHGEIKSRNKFTRKFPEKNIVLSMLNPVA